MSRFWRAFYGAAMGALLVLMIHPASRPFLLTALSKWGSPKTFQNNSLILESQSALPLPSTLVDASIWMQEAAVRVRKPQTIQPGEWSSFFNVAAHAAQQDPDNAYWVEMQAVLTNALGKASPAAERDRLRSLAIEEWGKAARLSRWDDYQTRRLRIIQNELAKEAGGVAAWQFAAVYPLHVTDSADAIDDFARKLLQNLDDNSKNSLQLRYDTLMNGKLLREGSRSIAVGEKGVNLVEIASYPREISPEPNPKAMVLTRTLFQNRLVKAGMIDESRQVVDAFKSNDGWLALLRQENIGDQTSELRYASLLTIDLPGALLALSIFGGLLWLIATILRLKPGLLKILDSPFAPAVGFVLAIAVYAFTHLVLAAIAVFACFGFMSFTPRNDRTRATETLGTAFEITQFILGCVLAILLTGFFVGLSTPGCQVLQEMGVDRDFYGGSTLLLGLAGIVIALLSLLAPCWAVVQRIATPAVVVAALRQFGRGMFLACLALAIVSTPICVLLDHYVQGKLDKIVANEPVFYLPA